MLSSRAVARVYPYAAVIPFLLTGLVPDTLNPGIVTVVGLLIGGALCIAGPLTDPRPIPRVSAVTTLLFAVVAALSLASLAARWP